MTTEMRVVKRPMEMGQRGFEMDLDGAIRFATGLIQGGMVPKGITNPGAVVGLIEAGKELGLAPMYALANLTFTNGRLGIMGDAAKALIRRSGALKPGTDFAEVYEGEEFTASWKCTVTAWRDGQPAAFSESFSIADAITARLVRLNGTTVLSKTRDGYGESGPWTTYTKRMLMYRALGYLCRDRFSDVLGGAVLQEELRDYPSIEVARDVAPSTEPDPLLASVAVEAPIEAELVPLPDPPASHGRDYEPPAPEPIVEPPAVAPNEERITAVMTALRARNTLGGVALVWKAAKQLRDELDPASLDRLELAHEARLNELQEK